MKQRISAANISIAITFSLIALSFSFGYRSYSQTSQQIVSDLSQALRQSVMQNMTLWTNQDSIQAYTHLQEIMGAPVSVSSSNKSFTEALNISKLKRVSGIYFHILKKNEQVSVLNIMPEGCIMSDTLLWLSPNGEASSDITLSFRGYAQCPSSMIFALSNQRLPMALLLAALLWASVSFIYLRCKKQTIISTETQEETKHLTFGNLTLHWKDTYFYNEAHKKLHLTPMQYALMEMFYLSPSHQLSKADICQAIWPGKENADETLYALIRRLKPIVEEHSNLKIVTDRGRAYSLEING